MRYLLIPVLILLTLGCLGGQSQFSGSEKGISVSSADDLESRLFECYDLAKAIDRDRCLLIKAKESGEYRICPLIQDNGVNYWGCVRNFIDTGDARICQILMQEGARDYCNQQIASNTQNERLCQMIVNQSMGDKCLLGFGIQKKTLDTCNLITGQMDKDFCIEAVAINTDNSSLCSEVEDELIKATCKYQIEPGELPKSQTDIFEMYYIYSNGCPHCTGATKMLKILDRSYPDLKINYLDGANDADRMLFENMADKIGGKVFGVPTFIIGDEVISGFDNQHTIGRQIREKIMYCLKNKDEYKNPE